MLDLNKSFQIRKTENSDHVLDRVFDSSKAIGPYQVAILSRNISKSPAQTQCLCDLECVMCYYIFITLIASLNVVMVLYGLRQYARWNDFKKLIEFMELCV